MTGEIERIVVALDAASENRAAIDTAARLAARWQAPLHGVFVEDDDLHPPGRPAVRPPGDARRRGRGADAAACRAADCAPLPSARGRNWRRRRGGTVSNGRSRSSHDAAASHDTVAVGPAIFSSPASPTRPIGGHFRVECRWWSVVEPGGVSFLLAHREGPGMARSRRCCTTASAG